LGRGVSNPRYVDSISIAQREAMKSLTAVLFSVVALMFTASPARAALVTINSLQFELDQFIGARVTTTATNDATNPNSSTDEIVGSTFDNPNGIDGFTLGELAGPRFVGDMGSQFSVDPGDRITLNFGQDSMTQDILTLTYAGAGFLLSSINKFVVFEQASGVTTGPADLEATNFEINFNSGMFFNASVGTLTRGVLGMAVSDPQNQIVFDLSAVGLMPGVLVKTVTIRNLVGAGDQYDPDFLFAGFSVPEPSSLLVFAIGAVGCGVTARRRRKRADGC
jgi:hypothetical protein